MNKVSQIVKLFSLIGLTALIACGDDSTGPTGSAQLQILLTDAPADIIGSAVIWVSRVYVISSDEATEDEETQERVDLFNDPENPRSFDLLTLQDGITTDLTGVTDVNADLYTQLRIVVDSARVTLIDGVVFSDGTNEAMLSTPSAAQSGIKVTLNSPITAEDGTTTLVVVDFDVNDNFVLQGNPDTPAGLNGISFTPRLKELSREEFDPEA